jgi:hypothetical protein
MRACLYAVLSAAVLISATPARSAEVALRAVSAFAEKTYAARPFEEFIERVNAAGKGIVQINYIGGPKPMRGSSRKGRCPSCAATAVTTIWQSSMRRR